MICFNLAGLIKTPFGGDAIAIAEDGVLCSLIAKVEGNRYANSWQWQCSAIGRYIILKQLADYDEIGE